MIDVEFDWITFPEGYEVHRSRLIPQGGSQRTRPLEIYGTMFTTFANLDDSAETFADFMTAAGPLTNIGCYQGERLEDLRARRQFMSTLLATAQNDPKILLRIDANSPAQKSAINDSWEAAAAKVTGKAPPKTSGPRISACALSRTILRPVPPDGRPGLLTVPDSLWDAMLIQLFQAISGGASLKTCARCAGWFAVGGGAKRADSKFCSDDCRVRAHLEKTKGAKA